MSRAGAEFRALEEEALEAFRAWERDSASWSDGRFRELALSAFELQFRRNRPYRRYCEARGVHPDGVDDWTDIPPAPTAAFREVDLVVGDPGDAVLEFRTSGTTRGPERRGRHLVLSPELYRASLEPTFRRFVLQPAGADVSAEAGFRIGSLVSSSRDDPGSSLSWMVDAVLERFGGPGSRHLGRAGAIDWTAAAEFVRGARRDGVPVCLLTTTLAADEWTRRLEDAGAGLTAPSGSVLMDTGGAKGREGLRRADVVARVEERLGIPRRHVINEFGMTELLSQRYGRLPSTDGDDSSVVLEGPPWLRTRSLDPVSLEELPAGETGVLCHFDLANLGSVSAVLTEDLGRIRPGKGGGEGVIWEGRSPGAPPRGCSLATAELLRAAES